MAKIDTRAGHNFDVLRAMIERQELIIQTLLRLLIEKKVIDKDEFAQWIDYVDRLDGKLDAKLEERRTPVTCPKCKRPNPHAARLCAYCSAELPLEFLKHDH